MDPVPPIYISNFMLELTVLHFEIYIALIDLGSVEVLLEGRGRP
jgi:hypothetical protein